MGSDKREADERPRDGWERAGSKRRALLLALCVVQIVLAALGLLFR